MFRFFNMQAYPPEPEDKAAFTQKFDNIYSHVAVPYDLFVKFVPLWRNWIRQAIPHIKGKRVLELSPGTGWLFCQYAGTFECYALDYNRRLLGITRRNLQAEELPLRLARGTVEALPYADETFDCIVNTMAFSAYPDGEKAMSEISRVLKPGGRVVMIDCGYPFDRGNQLGMLMARAWIAMGDILRDMPEVFRRFHLNCCDSAIACFGTIHLYVAEKCV